MRIKARVGIWAIVIVIAVIVTYFSNITTFFKNIFSDNRQNIEISLFTDFNSNVDRLSSGVDLKTDSKNGYNVKFSLNNENADIILTNEKLNNDSQYDLVNTAYSPIIMVAPKWIYDNTSNFNFVEYTIGGSTYKSISCNTIDFVNAIINGDTWKEFGNNSSDTLGKIKIIVPRQNTSEGKYVYSFIYETIKNEYPNLTEQEILNKTNIFYNKCIQSSSIATEMLECYNNDENSEYYNYVWLIPELMISNSMTAFNYGYSDRLYPVYFENTFAIPFYVYAKQDSEALDNFNEYAQEIFMKKLTIRYDNTSFSTMKDAYRNFKTIINYSLLEKTQNINNEKISQTNQQNKSEENFDIINEDIEEETSVLDSEESIEEDIVENENVEETPSALDVILIVGLVLIGVFVVAIAICSFYEYY